MKRIACEMCGGNELIKENGVFVCQFCGTKYSLEEAKKLMVDISGSTVKIDQSEELKNLYRLARRAKDENSLEDMHRYYDLILMKEPDSWEAFFYVEYVRVIAEPYPLDETAERFRNKMLFAIDLAEKNLESADEKVSAVTEIAQGSGALAAELFKAAEELFKRNRPTDLGTTSKTTFLNSAFSILNIEFTLGDHIEHNYVDRPELKEWPVQIWKCALDKERRLKKYVSGRYRKQYKQLKEIYTAKILGYEPWYKPGRMH